MGAIYMHVQDFFPNTLIKFIEAISQGSSSETILGCNIIQQGQKATTFVKDHLAYSSTLLKT